MLPSPREDFPDLDVAWVDPKLTLSGSIYTRVFICYEIAQFQ